MRSAPGVNIPPAPPPSEAPFPPGMPRRGPPPPVMDPGDDEADVPPPPGIDTPVDDPVPSVH